MRAKRVTAPRNLPRIKSAVTRKRRQPRLVERLLRRGGSLLLWAGVLVLAAFGIVFSFANYPWFGTAVVLLILLAIGYSERRRRIARKAKQSRVGRCRGGRCRRSGLRREREEERMDESDVEAGGQRPNRPETDSCL